MNPKRTRTNLLALTAFALLLTIWFVSRAKSDDYMIPHHPPQDMLLHERFYSTWNTHGGDSCCNRGDCYPTRAVFDDALGLWRAERREDHRMIVIPKSVYDPDHPERERESPDGQSHLCAPSPYAVQLHLSEPPSIPLPRSKTDPYFIPQPDKVLCFTPGEGH